MVRCVVVDKYGIVWRVRTNAHSLCKLNTLVLVCVLGCGACANHVGISPSPDGGRGDGMGSDAGSGDPGDSSTAGCELSPWSKNVPAVLDAANTEILDPEMCFVFANQPGPPEVFEEVSQYEFEQACWTYDINFDGTNFHLPGLGGYTRVAADGVTETGSFNIEGEYPIEWRVSAGVATANSVVYFGKDAERVWAQRYSPTGKPLGDVQYILDNSAAEFRVLHGHLEGPMIRIFSIAGTGYMTFRVDPMTLQLTDIPIPLLGITSRPAYFLPTDQRLFMFESRFEPDDRRFYGHRVCLNEDEADTDYQRLFTGAIPLPITRDHSASFHAITVDDHIAMTFLTATGTDRVTVIAFVRMSFEGELLSEPQFVKVKEPNEVRPQVAFDGEKYLVAYLAREAPFTAREAHLLRFDRNGIQQGCRLKIKLKRTDYGSGRDIRYSGNPLRLRAFGDTFALNVCTTNADESNFFAPWGLLARFKVQLPVNP